MTTDTQPPFDAPLGCGLTPREITESILFSAERCMWHFDSRINDEFVVDELVARNERTGFVSRWAQSELVRDGKQLLEFVVELQIGGVYVSGDWTLGADAGQAEIAHVKALSETTFISTCGLIGKRAQRKLVVL